MTHTIVLIPGDGIGKEIMPEAVKVLNFDLGVAESHLCVGQTQGQRRQAIVNLCLLHDKHCVKERRAAGVHLAGVIPF